MKNKKNFLVGGFGVVLVVAAFFVGLIFNGKDVTDDIVILYTNDVHCGIEENIGYAGVAAYKKAMEEKTPFVTLVDCGDAIQGDFIGLTSEGEYIVDIMNEVGYDYAVLGNHEFDYGMEQIDLLMDKAEATYLGCNITYGGKEDSALEDVIPYEIKEYGDTSVAFIGVSTPECITSSTPTYFMEDGEYVYDFANGEDGQELYNCVQGYVDECKEKGADYVVLMAHLGDVEEHGPYSSVELVKATEGIDVVLDGHAHSTISCKIVDNKDGEDVLISSTGSKISNIGQLIITPDGNVSTGLISSYEKKDAQTEKFIASIKETYEKDLIKKVATSEVTLSCSDAEGIRLIRTCETGIGNLCADAYRIVAGADIGVVNGGGIRADLPAGDITYQNLFEVHPFGNTLCMVEATGQEIVDFLEMCYRNVLPETSANGQAIGEDGSFQHVSGLKFAVDTSVESSVMVDENDMFVSVDGERRVKDVLVQNEAGLYVPIDLEGVYKIASHNYLIKEGGSGYGKFMDNELLIDEGMADYQVLIEYMTKTLEGKIGQEYAKLEGRITIK